MIAYVHDFVNIFNYLVTNRRTLHSRYISTLFKSYQSPHAPLSGKDSTTECEFMTQNATLMPLTTLNDTKKTPSCQRDCYIRDPGTCA
ncbi:hypothetical protein CEXT_454171 [Caerostris extrusa]|uniref:Uncharacterized protein n=1 Tax=Caerostris extrusa TaxID=172846 RepID=A0AAV4WS00_CAEEX|nr:hypothetical protein CEXT_454171 [Caerostris extrusa]